MPRERKTHADKRDPAQAGTPSTERSTASKAPGDETQLFHFFLRALARDLARRDHAKDQA